MSRAVTDTGEDAQRVRREVVGLMLLLALAIGGFLATHQIARWEQDRSLTDAGAWYARGTAQFEARRTEEAVVSLRRAYAKNRTNRQYAIALAHALSASTRSDDAAGILLTLREATPEDPEINLELARLATTRDNLTDAVRYYHSALYGVWPAGRDGVRESVRIELVRLLLTHDRRESAVAELIALTTNLPDTPAEHTEAGQLLLEASEPRLALEQFRRAIGNEPGYTAAMAGAGAAAFQLGDYAAVRRYLQGLSGLSPSVAQMDAVAGLVLDRDPLAPRLRPSERRRRVNDLLAGLRERMDACRSRPQPPAADAVARLDAAQVDLQGVDTAVNARAVQDEGELVESALDVLYRSGLTTTAACGSIDAFDRALLLIGRSHQGPVQ